MTTIESVLFSFVVFNIALTFYLIIFVSGKYNKLENRVDIYTENFMKTLGGVVGPDVAVLQFKVKKIEKILDEEFHKAIL